MLPVVGLQMLADNPTLSTGACVRAIESSEKYELGSSLIVNASGFAGSPTFLFKMWRRKESSSFSADDRERDVRLVLA